MKRDGFCCNISILLTVKCNLTLFLKLIMDSACCSDVQSQTGVRLLTKCKHGENDTTVFSNMLKDMFKVSQQGTSAQLRDHYNEISEYYDEYCVGLGKDCGARNFANIVHSIQQNKAARLLDVGCGNGLLGTQLKDLGYTNIDGLDFAQRMLDLCKSKGLYSNYICASIEPGKKVPDVADNTYDVVCLNGCMAGGHITPDCIPVLARMVKPGGAITFNINIYWEKNIMEFAEDAVRAKLQAFVDCGVLTDWSKTTHIYFGTTGEQAPAYILTVA